jgi:hypothetical protein
MDMVVMAIKSSYGHVKQEYHFIGEFIPGASWT